MPILLCLLLILSLEVQAAPADTTMGLDAQVQSLRIDRLERAAVPGASGQGAGQSELEGLFARFRSGRIRADDLTRLVRQLIGANLPQGANTVLDSPAAKPLTAEAREALWFEVASAWQQRGYPNEAQAALGHITPLRRGVRFEHLQAKVAMEAGRRDEALSTLESLNRKGQASALEKYNLAVLMLAENAPAREKEATAILSGLLDANAGDAAPKNLAAVTLGRVLLDAEDHKSAVRALQKVDNDSVYAPEAHYLLAKAHMAADQTRKAIGLWEELSRRMPTDPYTERAMMTLPPALGALDATGEAIARITSIQKLLEQAITDLSAALNELATPAWIEGITPIAGQDRLEPTDVARIPAAPYVLDIISGNRFQLALTDIRTLRELAVQDLPEDMQRRRETLMKSLKDSVTAMIKNLVELRLNMLERDLLDTRFEYALLLDNQAEPKK
ncbi:MAG: hypothetical protein GC138_09565 [Gammaproteobacteria bacterium]|nr:hypothetical protein [Gammaproteobacteria bacterium]